MEVRLTSSPFWFPRTMGVFLVGWSCKLWTDCKLRLVFCFLTLQGRGTISPYVQKCFYHTSQHFLGLNAGTSFTVPSENHAHSQFYMCAHHRRWLSQALQLSGPEAMDVVGWGVVMLVPWQCSFHPVAGAAPGARLSSCTRLVSGSLSGGCTDASP